MPTGPLSSSRIKAESIGSSSLRSLFRISLGRDNLLGLLEMSVDAAALIGSLLALTLYWESAVPPPYILLMVLLFALAFPGASRLNRSLFQVLRDVVFGWLLIAGLLALFGSASKLLRLFDRDAMLHWLWLAPTVQFAGHVGLRALAPMLLALRGESKRAVIAGMNEQGIALARAINADPYCGNRVLGFFDDRAADRLSSGHGYKVLGGVDDMPAYVRDGRIETIYLSLPMATQPRILQLLDALRDTTVSIYFIPDIFVTDLIQGRMNVIGNMPVVAVCETPFTGINSIIKRATDLVAASLILVLIAPLLAAIAAAVKLTSPGPVIFKQRR